MIELKLSSKAKRLYLPAAAGTVGDEVGVGVGVEVGIGFGVVLLFADDAKTGLLAYPRYS